VLKNKPKAFFVTGSSSGIGRSIADELHSSGVNVIYHGKSEREANLPPKCEYVSGDLSKEDVAGKIGSYVIGKYDLEGLVCCAGRTHLSPSQDNPVSLEFNDMRTVFDNILVCTVLACQKITPHFISKKSGKIVIIGGDVVDKPNENGHMCAYAVFKAAVHQYGLYLSAFMRQHNVSVNVVSPTGVFRNESQECCDDSLIRRACKTEVAKMVGFLCRNNTFVSGQVIRINGGRISY
jgi:NAD(P)-dependent dehydrogenase (short-subunit alcohol dehydrogenase family)